MKPRKNELRLERAFTEMPETLSDAVEAAFERGEREMKRRHKLMTALTAMAACAVLFAMAGLAMGRLTAPKRDVVAAASATRQADALSQPDAIGEKTVYTVGNARFYHVDPDCSGMTGAVAMRESEAVAGGKTPCPICAEVQPEATLVWQMDGDGTWYHAESDCLPNAEGSLIPASRALAMGLRPCPECSPWAPPKLDLAIRAFGWDFPKQLAGGLWSDDLPSCWAITWKGEVDETTAKLSVWEAPEVTVDPAFPGADIVDLIWALGKDEAFVDAMPDAVCWMIRFTSDRAGERLRQPEGSGIVRAFFQNGELAGLRISGASNREGISATELLWKWEGEGYVPYWRTMGGPNGDVVLEERLADDLFAEIVRLAPTPIPFEERTEADADPRAVLPTPIPAAWSEANPDPELWEITPHPTPIPANGQAGAGSEAPYPTPIPEAWLNAVGITPSPMPMPGTDEPASPPKGR